MFRSFIDPLSTPSHLSKPPKITIRLQRTRTEAGKHKQKVELREVLEEDITAERVFMGKVNREDEGKRREKKQIKMQHLASGWMTVRRKMYRNNQTSLLAVTLSSHV